ncbi:protein kinase-like protein [Leptomonas pyrrhocoris]|uniref:Protein kinase-like protein n=1 Tax=Leptomonas pyrrhocoris TaxID=157538 RepID=A0A0M9G7J1_LEPPY|nr:protein kinase-like protein [Leptomonas pyrrhocoris]KPA84280.1 protein kinase-like protein [Leptomonas pyrrhocoris]|eukprot:XP_015662719.1 protein kinase-like protein [Leptomonas pyrrhocoris]
MPVSSLLERMRKKLQEKAAAAGGSKSGPADSTNVGSSNTGEDGALSNSNAPQNSSSNYAPPAMPLPPPVFASPSSARLDYRDTANDPLCVPFTADMAAPILTQLLHTFSPTEIEPADAANASTAPASTDKPSDVPIESERESPTSATAHFTAGVHGDARSVQRSTAVVDEAARHLREFLAVVVHDDTSAAEASSPAPSTTTSTTPTTSLYEDTAYVKACALGRVDVSGAVRPMCRDVQRYKRVGSISQGVYGVVFRAVAADDDGDAAPNSTDEVANSKTAVPTTNSSSATPSLPLRKSYALKHIKKMWLEDSQIGFPPYLMREIDLLLRLRHPNVMGARELVLLDPTPLPQPRPMLAVSMGPASHVAHSRRRPREAVDVTADHSPGDASSVPHHPKPRKDSLTAAASDSGNSDAASAPARPLAAVGAVGETKDVFLVMDFCPFDLTTYMRRYRTTPTGQIPYFHVTSRNAHPGAAANYVARAKSIAYQLFNAVAFMHANRVLHRDLKTSNVLLDDDGYVKVCDFGLGRLYREGQSLTPTVVTLMYRAPELHLGVVDYSHKMDVWSLGCILAELFLRRPLFHASTDSNHLLAVCDVIGIPTEETFAGLYHLPQTKVMMQSLPRWNRVSRLADLFKPGATMSTPSHGDMPVAAEAALLPAEGLELLQSIFQWNPRRRPSAEDVLRHSFFHTEPLPCAPAELMHPVPWKDAAPPASSSSSNTTTSPIADCAPGHGDDVDGGSAIIGGSCPSSSRRKR